MASQITDNSTVQQFILANIKENIKAPHLWSFVRGSTGKGKSFPGSLHKSWRRYDMAVHGVVV